MDFYREQIIDHSRYPRNKGTISRPTHTAEMDNPFCGDRIRIEVCLERGKVADIGFSGEGCAISQASASLLTEEVKKIKDIKKIKKLKKKDVFRLMNVKVSAAREKCALLSLWVLRKIF